MRSLSDREDKQAFILIGKITGAHGIKGVLKIQSHAESVDTFSPGLRLIGKAPDGCEQTLTVQWAQAHGQTIRLSLDEVTDRNQAEDIAGTELYMRRSDLPELDEDSFYWCDLIGLKVVTAAGDVLGKLVSVLPTGSNDVYVVESTEDGQASEILIPGTESVVLEIDLERKTMTVDPPEGL